MAPTSEQRAACIGGLLVDFKSLGEGSKIASCLCQNKGQVYQGQSPQLDQTNDLDYEGLREMSQESSGPQSQVNRRQDGDEDDDDDGGIAGLLAPVLAGLKPIGEV